MQHHMSGAGSVTARVGDEIVVDLVEQSGAGYEWHPTTPPGLEPVSAGRPPAPAPTPPAIGAGVPRRLTFRVVSAGRHVLQLQHRRVWEGADRAIGHVVVTIDAAP